MKQSERPCRTCGELNESSAYACRACGVSLRLSPPKRPAPSLSPPVVAPKLSNANDTLDIETELPDEEIELLARATPSPQAVELLDGLATLDEAADGLAPSASFDELELLAPGTNMPPLSPRKEPSLQDSLTIDPLSELPKNTEILSRPKIHKSVSIPFLIASGLTVGIGVFIMQGVELKPQGPSSTPSVTELPSELSRSQGEGSQPISVRVSLRVEELTQALSSADPAVLRAQARAWSSASATALKLSEQRGVEDAAWVRAQLERAEALRFEREVERLERPADGGGALERPVGELKSLSEALSRLEQTDALAQRSLKPWFEVLSELRPALSQPPGASQWTQALALISSAEPSALIKARALLRGARGEGCAPKLYGLRAEQLLGEQAELARAYKDFSNCLTQLIVEARLSTSSSPRPLSALRSSSHNTVKKHKGTQRSLKQRGGATRRGTAQPPSERGGYRALMSQGAKALERGQVAQAQAAFKRASALKAQDPNPISQLGWCELAARNPRGALAYFKRALSLKSNYGDALYGLGYAHERMRKWTEARAHFERYLELYPNGAKVRIIQNKLNKMPK